jgi:hypothetical protein
MPTTQTVITIDRDLWRQFKGGCILRSSSPTAQIARFVEKKVAEWARESARDAQIPTLVPERSK